MSQDIVNTNVLENQEISEMVGAMKTKLERDVSLKVTVIGVGNAGNQSLVYAKKEGFNVFAVNSSVKDLSDEIVDGNIPSFVIGDEARGAGKNRDKADQLFKINGKDLFKQPTFIGMVQEADIVFVVGATGGGTGSKIGPNIVRILTRAFPKKIHIFIGVTPKNSDSLIAKNNTIQCIEEIKTCEVPYLLEDLGFYEDIPNDEAFTAVGADIIQKIKAIAGHYLHMSKSQMIDENDMKTLVKEAGYMGVYYLTGVTSMQLEQKTLQSMMIDKIKHSPAMMVQKDGIIKQMGIIINSPMDMEEATKTGNYSELTKFLGGDPRGIFENYAVSNGTDVEFILIVSGMTLPYNRISVYRNALAAADEQQKRVKDINLAKDVEMFGYLSSEADEKLSSDTSASSADISAALDDFFN